VKGSDGLLVEVTAGKVIHLFHLPAPPHALPPHQLLFIRSETIVGAETDYYPLKEQEKVPPYLSI